MSKEVYSEVLKVVSRLPNENWVFLISTYISLISCFCIASIHPTIAFSQALLIGLLTLPCWNSSEFWLHWWFSRNISETRQTILVCLKVDIFIMSKINLLEQILRLSTVIYMSFNSSKVFTLILGTFFAFLIILDTIQTYMNFALVSFSHPI